MRDFRDHPCDVMHTYGSYFDMVPTRHFFHNISDGDDDDDDDDDDDEDDDDDDDYDDDDDDDDVWVQY